MATAEVAVAAAHAYPLVAVAIIFFLDGLGLPLLPELAAIVAFSMSPTLGNAAVILTVVAATEVAATFLLCVVVQRFGWPRLLRRLMMRYTTSIPFSDERLILVNRFVPVLPMTGAFIAVNSWRLPRSMAFVVVGSVVKFGLLFAFSGAAYAYFSGPSALWLSLALAGAFQVGAVGFSVLKRLRAPRQDVPQPSP